MAKQLFKDPNGKDNVSIEECVLDKKIEDFDLSKYRTDVCNYIPQDTSLFEHLNVIENIKIFNRPKRS